MHQCPYNRLGNGEGFSGVIPFPITLKLQNETMPEIIPETRGRSPLPKDERKKMISFRISPSALSRLDKHILLMEAQGNKITKAKALENAIMKLPTCDS
tara:strand:+ start:4046 stop:4342 length:297 start_codon:yes stop_codon:yes gene_type:complete